MLVLDILKNADTLKMSLFEQGEFSSTIRHYTVFSYPVSEVNSLCLGIIDTLNKITRNSIHNADSADSIRKSGQLLWNYVLTRTVKERLRNSPVQELALSLDEELINIPWELLYDGREFLSLKFNMGRLVRSKDLTSPVRYRSVSPSLKMLVLANPTNDLKSAHLEGLHIKNQFERKRNQISIDFKATNIDTLYVKKNLCDYDIVHFAGHCEYDCEDSYRSGWVLNDGRFSGHDVLALSDTVSLPALVFSNACHSARLNPGMPDRDYQIKTYSLASAFLFSGVRHYIGAIRRIEDPESLTFAKEFYARIVNGDTLGEAMRQARLKSVKEYGINSFPWASYVLYGDANFTFFSKHNTLRSGITQKFLRINRKNALFSLFVTAGLSAIMCLYLLVININPSSQFLFYKANKFFSTGKNEPVITISKKIIAKDPDFIKAYSLLAKTYQRLGSTEDAMKTYFNYAFYSEKMNDMRNLASAYIDIGWIHQLKGDYPKALEFYDKALALAKENKDSLNEAVALRKTAVWNIDKENYDVAMSLLMKSSEINRTKQYLRMHKYNLACDYFDIGLIFANKEDYRAAREFYQKSSDIFEKLKINSELSDCYFNLGEMYLFEKQYQKTLVAYSKGLEIDKRNNNRSSLASDYDMIGELYREMGDFKEAERSFLQALEIAREIKAPLEIAASSYNLGVLYNQRGLRSKARDSLRQAQEIYRQVDTPAYQKIKDIFASWNNQ